MAEIGEASLVSDWDSHWSRYGDAAQSNPANEFRRALIVQLLGSLGPEHTLVDIGCGQGELTRYLQHKYPAMRVFGIEYSQEGVRRAIHASRSEGLSTRFIQRDLLMDQPLGPAVGGWPPADLAVCSEVLEHVDDPALLLRNASSYLEPGCKLIVSVPGGPRSAFDRHIGHRQHFNPDRLHAVLAEGGFRPERIMRAGFPFFNMYRLMVVLRGRRLIDDLASDENSRPPSPLIAIAERIFRGLFRLNLADSPFGWQIVAVSRYVGRQGR